MYKDEVDLSSIAYGTNCSRHKLIKKKCLKKNEKKKKKNLDKKKVFFFKNKKHHLKKKKNIFFFKRYSRVYPPLSPSPGHWPGPWPLEDNGLHALLVLLLVLPDLQLRDPHQRPPPGPEGRSCPGLQLLLELHGRARPHPAPQDQVPLPRVPHQPLHRALLPEVPQADGEGRRHR